MLSAARGLNPRYNIVPTQPVAVILQRTYGARPGNLADAQDLSLMVKSPFLREDRGTLAVRLGRVPLQRGKYDDLHETNSVALAAGR
jgi:hypothetical protein